MSSSQTKIKYANVFVLCTGRCGSTTFAKACQHITNYSVDHESLAARLGENRLAYPENHIEIDNRLSWHLGRLNEKYGNDAFYVHLTRNPEEVIASFVKRRGSGIMRRFEFGLVRTPSPDLSDSNLLAKEICDTVTANVRYFLQDKTNKMDFHLENAAEDFRTFWDAIRAEGDFDAAKQCWTVRHNASEDLPRKKISGLALRKLKSMFKSSQKIIRSRTNG